MVWWDAFICLELFLFRMGRVRRALTVVEFDLTVYSKTYFF